MKYNFRKIDEDTIEFTYKDKTFQIYKDVDLLSKIQSINAIARAKMSADLKKQGMTVNDLIVVKKEGNKTIEDHSNVDYIETEYYNLACVSFIDDICNKYFEIGLDELVVDMELTDDEIVTFTQDLLLNIGGKGKTPSQKS